MKLDAFISYAHADEKYLDRLHKHFAMLIRDNLLNAWTDRKITPGADFGQTIHRSLLGNELFVALVSPDYLASQYCYEKEFLKAQELAESGRMRIVPIILEPCDWLSSPLSKYLALPKDGKPISEWSNPNIAFLDVVSGLRKLLNETVVNDAAVTRELNEKTRKIRLKRDFDAVQKLEFADESFRVIRAYFADSCRELNEVGGGEIKARFAEIDTNGFSCTVINRTKLSGGESDITVHNVKGRNHLGDIVVSFARFAEANSANLTIDVEADDFNLFLKFGLFSETTNRKLDAKQAAEQLWLDFVQRAGVEYT